MAKPIVTTKKMLEELVEEFRKQIQQGAFADGCIEFKRNYVYPAESGLRATVRFSQTAWIKMRALVESMNQEIAWHGTVERISDSDFYIKDILVYPQTVSGVTVDTDFDKIAQWNDSLPDDVFSQIRLQGHSHVSMGVTPSGRDLSDWNATLQRFKQVPDMFYIFMIVNKQGDRTIVVYDMKNNVMYENSDVDLIVDDMDLDGFIAEAKKMVSSSSLVEKSRKQNSRKKSDYPDSLYAWDDNWYEGGLR